jgi:hypothetical protein
MYRKRGEECTPQPQEVGVHLIAEGVILSGAAFQAE